MAPITTLLQVDKNNSFQNKKEGMPVIKIKEAKNQSLYEFYKIPWKIYQNNPYWVPPFWIEFKDFFQQDNPFWNHAESKLFISYKNGQPVGRIAAIIDSLYCQYNKEKIGFFGFFESVNDVDVAEKLFLEAERWLLSKGMTIMQGPIDGRVDNGCGFLCTGFNESQSLLSTYTPQYYLKLADHYDLKKARDQITYYVDLTQPLPRFLMEKAEQCKSEGFSIRRFNRFLAKKEIAWWVNLFLKTFEDHWGYVPVSPEEVKTRFGVKQLQRFVDSNLFLIAEYNNEPVGYLWATPDYNQLFKSMNGELTFFELLRFIWKKNQITKGKLHIIGVKQNFRGKHIASLLNSVALEEMKKRGYDGAEIGWIDEKNTAVRNTIRLVGAEIIKKHRVFEKDISCL